MSCPLKLSRTLLRVSVPMALLRADGELEVERGLLWNWRAVERVVPPRANTGHKATGHGSLKAVGPAPFGGHISDDS